MLNPNVGDILSVSQPLNFLMMVVLPALSSPSMSSLISFSFSFVFLTIDMKPIFKIIWLFNWVTHQIPIKEYNHSHAYYILCFMILSWPQNRKQALKGLSCNMQGNQWISSGHILSNGTLSIQNHSGFISYDYTIEPQNYLDLNRCTQRIVGSFMNSKSIVASCLTLIGLTPDSSTVSLMAASKMVQPGSTLPPKPFHLPAPKPLFFMPRSILLACWINNSVNTFLFCIYEKITLKLFLS